MTPVNTRGTTETERKVMESEKRVTDMIKELGQIQERAEARMEEMMKAIVAINMQNQVTDVKGEMEMVRIGGIKNKGGNEFGRSTRYEFPKFDGDGLEGWVMRSEFFFDIVKVTEDKEKVKTAALHLEGKALQWHRGFVSLQGEGAYSDWSGYVRAISARFGTHAYEDPLADLRNLKQTSSLQEYMDAFDELYPRTKVSGEQALSFFLSGLVDELQMPVRMFKPQNLDDAYALAKLQDLTVKAMHGKPKGSQGGGPPVSSYSSNNRSLSVTTTNCKPSGGAGNYGSSKEQDRGSSMKPLLRLSSKEMDEKKVKGLCFWCNEKFSPSHRCTKRRSYVMQLLEEMSQEESEGQEEEEESETA